MDGIQVSWARRLLRLRAPASGPSSLRRAALLWEAGWKWRFSTRMVWMAILDHARIMCYPDWHPVRVEVVRADALLPQLRPSVWPSAVRAWRGLLGIPDIRDADLFRALDRSRPEDRKAAVAGYRAQFLDRAVDEWETAVWWQPAMAADAGKPWPYLGVRGAQRVWALELAAEAHHPRFWRWYGAWVLARVSGRVPLGAVSDADSPETLEACPSCGATGAGLAHFVCRRPATEALCQVFATATGYRGQRADWTRVGIALFGPEAGPGARGHHVRLLGTIADRLAGRPQGRAHDDADD